MNENLLMNILSLKGPYPMIEWKWNLLKGIVHPKMKVLPPFMHLPFVPNLFELLACLEVNVYQQPPFYKISSAEERN